MNKTEAQRTIGLGVDVGGSHICCAAVDVFTGQVLPGSRVERKIDPIADKNTILKQWNRTLREGLQKIPLQQFLGIGIAMPGPFDYKEGICLMEGVGKYESLHGVNVKEYLQRALGLYGAFPIVFENDASCFVLGEDWQGAAQKRRRVLGITLGTGMGSTFLKEGRIQKKGTGVPRDGFLYYLPWHGKTADDCFSSSGLINNANRILGKKCSGVKEMAELAEQNEALRELFVAFGEELADFLTPWLVEFQADVLVLGGNITRAWNWFGDTLEDELDRNEVLCRVERSHLWEDAALCGAVRLLQNELEKIEL